MKTTLCFALFAVFSTAGARAQTPTLPNQGTLNMKFAAASQSWEDLRVSSKTKFTETTVTTVDVFKSTSAIVVIDSADLLNLLENSMNTNFPSGARLVVTLTEPSRFSVLVANRQGTVIHNPGTNLFLLLPNEQQPVHTGQTTRLEVIKNNEGRVSGKDVQTYTLTAVLGYNDTGLATRDGTHTEFQVQCLATGKWSSNIATGKFSSNLKMQGHGFGTIRDRHVILQGIATAVVTGGLPPN